MKSILPLFIILFLSLSIAAQSGSWLKGYTADVSGEVLTYHSPHPEVTSSLLIRNQDSTKYIEWMMDEVPVGTDTHAFTFVWIFGIDVNVNTYTYRLYLDDKYLLSFKNPHDTLLKKWEIEGVDGSSLSFNASLVDKYGDFMGYAFLRVPQKLLKVGKKPSIRITATSSGDPCWYMTHRYAMDSRMLVKQMPAMKENGGEDQFVLRFDIHHFGEPTVANIIVKGETTEIPIQMGVNYTYIPVGGKAGDVIDDISVSLDNEVFHPASISLKEVKPMTLYLLHHSHADIGYTHHQSVVERLHHDFFREVTDLWFKTEDYPEGARFKWNTEVAWAVESYLQECSPEEKEEFINAVQEGGIGIDGLWANELTGLCRPEELIQLIQRSAKVAKECGIELRSAMITDIPGYTWSLVPVMAKSGIRYFSPGTNTFHRIGNIKDTWGDKPFYWISQSGEDSVLTWFPGKGYSWFHTGLGAGKPKNLLTEEPLFEYLNQLDTGAYPYDISIFRYNIGSDNGPPHADLPDIIKRWNETYSTPKMYIATTSEAFAAFENKYGKELPSYKGDLTPYWEDGAASSAYESAITRQAAERLTQAQTLWVISGNKHYPLEQIDEAWKNILLFDEHTWGSWNSISAPLDTFTIHQWNTKRAFALKADRISSDVMKEAVQTLGENKSKEPVAFDIWNTHSWPVKDIVMLPVPASISNAYATDENNNRFKSQRLSDGRLAVLVNEVPPFASIRIFIKSEDQIRRDPDPIRQMPFVNISFNNESGDITAFRNDKLYSSLADISMGYGLNSYIYVEGRDPSARHSTRNTRITYLDKGELVNIIRISSDAPGTNGLFREISILNGVERVDIKNTIFKTEVYEPEGLHFGFPFKIPDGEINVGLAWGYYQPETNQLPGSNKNFYTMNRWVDVSSEEQGVCLISLDAPLIELGEISNDATSYGWRETQEPTQTVFSYVMNNYWETNYLAAQPGKAEFRYSLILGEGFDPVANEKRSLERAQPLLVVPASNRKRMPLSLFTLNNENVLATALIPGRDKGHFLVRIYNPTGNDQEVLLNWNLLSSIRPAISTSDLSGQDAEPLSGPLKVAPYSFETLKLEF